MAGRQGAIQVCEPTAVSPYLEVVAKVKGKEKGKGFPDLGI